MIDVIIIGGLPGTGKTTLMREIRKTIAGEIFISFKTGLVVGETYPELGLTIIGAGYDTDSIYAGTDKLSMASQPKVLEYIQDAAPGTSFLIEGDRLFTKTFLHGLLDSGIKVTVFELIAGEPILRQRYEDRGSNQSDAFIRGRATKIHNVITDERIAEFVRTRRHHTPEHTCDIRVEIEALLNLND